MLLCKLGFGSHKLCLTNLRLYETHFYFHNTLKAGCQLNTLLVGRVGDGTPGYNSVVDAVFRKEGFHMMYCPPKVVWPRKWPTLGGSGGMAPPENFFKVDASRCVLMHSGFENMLVQHIETVKLAVFFTVFSMYH